ncbi:MAG: DUF1330 domain-containing protein [Rhizobiales bacterium]|nr:DUF1330 domain-containing protein [Hyphomicrobiales bacterium]
MAKGYWIAHIAVTDPAAYEKYRAANGAVFAAWGARFVVRGGQSENPEGKLRGRHVILEFDSYEKALACYRSPEYQELVRMRQAGAEGDVVIVEGV